MCCEYILPHYAASPLGFTCAKCSICPPSSWALSNSFSKTSELAPNKKAFAARLIIWPRQRSRRCSTVSLIPRAFRISATQVSFELALSRTNHSVRLIERKKREAQKKNRKTGSPKPISHQSSLPLYLYLFLSRWDDMPQNLPHDLCASVR